MSTKPNVQLHDILSVGRPKNSIDRLSIHIYLECLGYETPDYGLIDELYQNHFSEDKCVVWGVQGSQLMRLDQAFRNHRNNYGSMYVGNNGSVSVSCRFVQIGPNGFWVDIMSFDDWRSNKGNWEAGVVKGVYNEYHPLVEMPFFSIDYVRSDKVYAIDFDIEPSLRGYGLEDIIKPKEFKSLYRIAQKHFERKTCNS
jgi:hypothetical protein